MAKFVINLKLCHVLLGLFFLVFLMKCTNATQFKVGGSKGWTVPTEKDKDALNSWAQKKYFRVGDSLLFIYDSKYSVLEVTQKDYEKCNTKQPIQKFKDGRNTIKLFKIGPHYYISGNRDNCIKENMKMVVKVMECSSGASLRILSSICVIGVLLPFIFFQ